MSRHVLRVITYHRVLDGGASTVCNPSLVSATPAGFEQQMRFLARRYRVVSGDEVVAAYREGRRLPDRATLITFDDGYLDVGEIAWPILRRYGLTATVFVPTAFVETNRRFWWDRLYQAIQGARVEMLNSILRDRLPVHSLASRASTLKAMQQLVKTLPHDEAMELVDSLVLRLQSADELPQSLLSWAQLRELSREGMTLGAHTRTHPVLTNVPLDTVKTEIRECREDLRREVGILPSIFAYPFGAHDSAVMEVARREGLDVAVTCLDGHNEVGRGDPMQLCRTNITPRTTLPVFRLRMSRIGPYIDRWRHRGATQSMPRSDTHAGSRPLPHPAPVSSARE